MQKFSRRFLFVFRFMPPDDPLGRHGPTLHNFLSKKPVLPFTRWQPCPYGRFSLTPHSAAPPVFLLGLLGDSPLGIRRAEVLPHTVPQQSSCDKTVTTGADRLEMMCLLPRPHSHDIFKASCVLSFHSTASETMGSCLYENEGLAAPTPSCET